MSNQEERIQAALVDLDNQKFCSIRPSAAFHNVPKSTLAHRRRGRTAFCAQDPTTLRIDPMQERILIRWIQDLQQMYMSPNYQKIKLVANQLLKENGDKKPLGKHWITRFRQRYPELKSGRSKAMEIKRLTALSPDIIELHFNQIHELKLRYNIDSSRIYNMDEKGFQMGQHRGNYTIFDAHLGPPLAPSTGITQWVTVIECIIANGTSLKPYIIFIGQEPETAWWLDSGLLQEWIWAFLPKG